MARNGHVEVKPGIVGGRVSGHVRSELAHEVGQCDERVDAAIAADAPRLAAILDEHVGHILRMYAHSGGQTVAECGHDANVVRSQTMHGLGHARNLFVVGCAAQVEIPGAVAWEVTCAQQVQLAEVGVLELNEQKRADSEQDQLQTHPLALIHLDYHFLLALLLVLMLLLMALSCCLCQRAVNSCATRNKTKKNAA